MTYNRDLFKSILVSKEDYEAFMEWSREFQNTYKTRFHKGYLAELLREGKNCTSQLRAKQQIGTHTSSKMYGAKDIGTLHLEVIRIINEKFGYENHEDKSLFKIPHFKIKNVIKDVFNKVDDRTIRTRRDEILPLLDLEVIQEKGQWFVVNKAYVPITPEKPLIQKSKSEVLIEKIKNSKHGLLHTHCTQFCGSPKVYSQFKEAANQENISLDLETDRFVYKKNPKVSAEQEADAVFAKLGYGGEQYD